MGRPGNARARRFRYVPARLRERVDRALGGAMLREWRPRAPTHRDVTRWRSAKLSALAAALLLAVRSADSYVPEPCEDYTRFEFSPALGVPGIYQLEISGDGYRSSCALVLTEGTPFWEINTDCSRAKLILWLWERALPAVQVPRALRHVHVELTRGATVVYAGDVTPGGWGEGRRCQYLDATLELLHGERPNTARP